MEDFKAGDKVNHYTYGTGVALDDPRILVHFDNPLSVDRTRYQEWVKAINLTKIKPKVKRWRWVYGRKFLSVTNSWYTEEEVKKVIPNLQVIEKVCSTEKEFDD